MRGTWNMVVAVVMLGSLMGCGPTETTEQKRKEAQSPAGRAGQVAYGAAKVTGKVAKAAGRELEKAAHDAHEGWKDAAAKDKGKK